MFKLLDTVYQEQILERLSQPLLLKLVERLDLDDRARLLE